MPVSGNIGALGWFAYAKETTWGTAVTKTGFVNAAGSGFLPIESENLGVNPNYAYSSSIKATRDADTYAFQGQQVTTGQITYPLYPDLGAEFLIGMLGTESMTIGSSPTSSTTLASGSAAATTTISTTATFTTNDIIQVDDLASGKAEIRKVSGVTGAGPYTVTLDSALTFAHSNGATVAKVVAPYSHYGAPANTLNSYTFIKYLGLDGSTATAREYTGMVPAKFKAAVDNKGEVKVTADFTGLDESTLTGTSIPTFVAPTTQPVNWGTSKLATAAVGTDIDGSFTTQADFQTGDIELDNMVKSVYGLAGQVTPTHVLPTERRTQGKVNAYWAGDALIYTPFRAGTHTALQFQLLNATGRGAVISLPEVVWEKFSAPLKLADVIYQDLSYRALYNASIGSGVQIKVVNDEYLPLS